MLGARAHVDNEPVEAAGEPAASDRNASALREWLKALIPLSAGRSAGHETARPSGLDADPVFETGDAADPTDARAGIYTQDFSEARHHRDFQAMCDRLDTLTQQLSQLLEHVDRASHGIGASGEATVLDSAIAEIFARQRTLSDGEPDGPSMFPREAPAPGADVEDEGEEPPVSAEPNLSGLELQLKAITKQLEILRQPCRADEMITGLRQELAGISETLELLVPRTAFDALQSEVRALAERLDLNRDPDGDGLASLEARVAEIGDALRQLAPGELHEAAATIVDKIDQMSGMGIDPMTLQQLDTATSALRTIVTKVASGDALAALVNEIHALSEKIDRCMVPTMVETSASAVDRELLLALEREVSGIARTLNAKADQVPGTPTIEPLMESIAQKLDRFDLFNDEDRIMAPLMAHFSELGEKIDRLQPVELQAAEPSGFTPLHEQLGEIAEKIDRLQSTETDPGTLEPIQAQLAYLTETIERMADPRIETEALAALDDRMRAISAKLDRLEESSNQPRIDIGPLEQRMALLAERLCASEERLGNLHAIEHGMTELIARLDEIRKAAGVEVAPSSASDLNERVSSPARPEPAAAAFAGREAPRDFGGLLGSDEPIGSDEAAADAPWLKGAVESEQAPASSRAPSSEPDEPVRDLPGRNPAASLGLDDTPANDQGLPPDAPLEPGSGPPRGRPVRSAAERVAASQAMLGPVPADSGTQGPSRPNFIIAARRAAQAAMEQQNQMAAAGGRDEAATGTVGNTLARRVKSLFVTTSVILVALGAAGITLSSTHLLDFAANKAPSGAPASVVSAVANPKDSTAAATLVPPVSAPTQMPAAPSPRATASPNDSSALGSATAQLPQQFSAFSSADITGALGAPAAASSQRPAAAAAPAESSAGEAGIATWSDAIPPAMRSKALVAGLAAHNPGAAYEIGMRYAEGRGVNADMAAAARWLARAAASGVVPAQFRLGSMYEKGLGVEKNLAEARRLYLAAATRGNANAMHNLAVLYAEGVDGKPDFAAAAEWFGKAANYGVPDSQFNLAILFARGIGVEQNLGEAFKWFAVAAQAGDKDAAKKRDEIAERLDPQTLAAARLAASVFAATAQPEEAIAVRAPATGWDDAAVTVPKARPRARQPGQLSAQL